MGKATRKTHVFTAVLIADTALFARADSFDGKWDAQTLPQAGCSANNLHLNATDSKITGTMENDGSTMSLSADLKIGGSFNVDVANNNIAISGTFNGDTFNFHWKGPCGDQTGTGTKDKE